MPIQSIYGNPVPVSLQKSAERRFRHYARKFRFDPNESPSLVPSPEGVGYGDFGILTLRDGTESSSAPAFLSGETDSGVASIAGTSGIADVAAVSSAGFDLENGVVLGTIRMGFGHCRMAIALASAAHSLGYVPYWFDLMSFSGTAASKTIRHLEDLYNLGSRISQRSRFFNRYVWDYVTNSAAQKLSLSAEDASLSRIFAPLYRDLPRDMPFFSTHPWTGHAAVHAGMTDVVTIVPDNYPIGFHVVEGSRHVVQSPSAYMGYRTFHSMGVGMPISQSMPAEDIRMVGHYVDHEIVAGIEADCDARLKRIRDGRPRRFLLTMGGAGAQVLRFADIARTCKSAIADGKLSLLINMGDHKGRWADLEKMLRADGMSWTLHTEWGETRSFVAEAAASDVRGVHVFLHDDFYCAVYATNLLMRVADVMVTKPSELSYYPVPKLFIQRVGRHEAWGAIRGAEIGDGTIETASESGLRRTLGLLATDRDLPELYCAQILRNARDGLYDGAYNAVRLAFSWKSGGKPLT